MAKHFDSIKNEIKIGSRVVWRPQRVDTFAESCDERWGTVTDFQPAQTAVVRFDRGGIVAVLESELSTEETEAATGAEDYAG